MATPGFSVYAERIRHHFSQLGVTVRDDLTAGEAFAIADALGVSLDAIIRTPVPATKGRR